MSMLVPLRLPTAEQQMLYDQMTPEQRALFAMPVGPAYFDNQNKANTAPAAAARKVAPENMESGSRYPEYGRCGRRRLRMQRAPTTYSICALKVGEEHHATQGRRHSFFTAFATFSCRLPLSD
jgi:hypothetical protein